LSATYPYAPFTLITYPNVWLVNAPYSYVRFMAEQTRSISSILSRILYKMHGGSVAVDDIFSALGRRAYGPLLFALAILCFSPIGAIPGMPAITATLLILIAVQFFFISGNPWIPDWIARQETSADRARQGLKQVAPYLRNMENYLHPRLRFMFHPVFTHIAMLLVIILSLLMFPLGFIPFAVMVPTFAIAVLGMAIVSRDGLVMLAGLSLGLGAVGLSLYFTLSVL